MSETGRYELYRVVTDIEAIREAILERVEDLSISRMAVDDLGGFTPGYSSKLLCQPPMKLIGADSLPKLLKATGLVLMLAVDDQRMEQIRPKLKPKRKIRAVARIKRIKGFFTKENAAKYAAQSWADLSEKKRSRLARRAAKARWQAKKKREAMARAAAQSPSATASQGPLLGSAPQECPAPNAGQAGATRLPGELLQIA